MKNQSRFNIILSFILVGVNLLCLNFLIKDVVLRVDLTQDREYSISDVTKKTIRGLKDQVMLRGYFSRETHPKIAPLIPRMRDILDEYRLYSKGRIRIEFLDPKDDKKAEKEAFERFAIQPTPFMLDTKYEQGVKSAYFNLVVVCGDQHVKFGFRDLVEVIPRSKSVLVRLRNPEYTITRAIRKTVSGFKAIEAVLKQSARPIEIDLYFSDPTPLAKDNPKLAEYLTKRQDKVVKLLEQYQKKFGGKLRYKVIDPSGKRALSDKLVRKYGIMPLSASIFSQVTFHLDALVRYGSRFARLNVQDLPGKKLSDADFKTSLEEALKRAVPGFMKRIGIVGGPPPLPPRMRFRMPQPRGEFSEIRRLLGAEYDIQRTDLESGRPPLDVDVLMLLKPKKLSGRALYAIDQYLMYGGRLIVFLDGAELDPRGQNRITLQAVDHGLGKLLAHWGIEAGKGLVLDDRNTPYPLPVIRDLGGMQLRSIESVPYPYFIRADGDSIDRKNPIVGRLESVSLFWATPLKIKEKKGLRARVLIRSSRKAWIKEGLGDVTPTLNEKGGKGYTIPEKTRRHPLAVTLEGTIDSYFKNRPIPPPPKPAPGRGKKKAPEVKSATAKLTRSAPFRMVVVGDADAVSDLGISLLGGHYQFNTQFAMNLIDWTLAEEDMIQIRSRGVSQRLLKKMKKSSKITIEAANYIIVLLLIILAGIIRLTTRAKRKRSAIMARSGDGPPSAGSKKEGGEA